MDLCIYRNLFFVALCSCTSFNIKCFYFISVMHTSHFDTFVLFILYYVFLCYSVLLYVFVFPRLSQNVMHRKLSSGLLHCIWGFLKIHTLAANIRKVFNVSVNVAEDQMLCHILVGQVEYLSQFFLE